MDSPFAKFVDFNFSRFELIVQTNRHTDTSITDVAKRYCQRE